MAPHGKKPTTEQKGIILYLSNEGCLSYKMQSMTGLNSRKIKKFLKRMRERGNIENLPRRGGIRKTIPRDNRILFRSVKTNRRQTLKDVTARFNQRTGCNVSPRTVCRRLFREGYIIISQVNHRRLIDFVAGN